MKYENLTSQDKETLAELAHHLTNKSKDICLDNHCGEDSPEHNCESYAYISYKYNEKLDRYEDIQLLDICVSDYFQGFSEIDLLAGKDHLALPLPFEGNEKDLLESLFHYDNI